MIEDLRLKKVIKIFLFSIALVFLSAACNFPGSKPKEQEQVQRQLIQVSQVVEGVDKIDQSFNFYADENKTALDLLKSSRRVETKTFSGVGEFVESIDGRRADGQTEFWAFYVNGKQSNVGASEYKPQNNDVIEWKLEKIK
jgi:hypothetical protein